MVNVNYAATSVLKSLILLFLFLGTSNLNAQCSLACNGSTQVSLDTNCEALITPEMILNDQATSCPGGVFEVVVMDTYNVEIPTSPLVTAGYCDQTLYVKVIDLSSGNTCWGEIYVEDKLGPEISSCPTGPVSYSCSEFTVFDGPIYEDACSGIVEPILLSEVVTPLNCDPMFIKTVVRTYTAEDGKGNFAPECTITYKLKRIDLGPEDEPFAGCPQQYTVLNNNALQCGGVFTPGQTGGLILDTDTDGDGILDADLIWDDNGNGYPDVEEFAGPTLNGVPLFPTPDFYCNIGVFFDDIVLPTIGGYNGSGSCVTKIMRTWYIREWWCGKEIEKTCAQVFEITDLIDPEIICNGPINITTNVTTNPHDSFYGTVTCGAEISLPLPEATDNCPGNLHYDIEYPGGFISDYTGELIEIPMGTNIVIVTVYDECYNSDSCEIVVNVIDNTPPVAICDEFTAVGLTNTGLAHVFAETFDDGSYDDCKLKKMLVRRMDPSNCDCTRPHYNDMTYLGEYGDNHYYISQYPVQPFIAENMADAMGGFIATMGSADPAEGQFIASEAFGVQSDPYMLFRNGELTLISSTGSGIPLPGTSYNYIFEVDDPCTFSSYTEFCCADVGIDQMVVFRVVDIYGNFNDCMVTAEIQDKAAPTVICPPDMEVPCDFLYDINDLDFHFGSATFSGSCDVTENVVFLEDITQCNQGTLKRTFTGTNGNGISTSCDQIITFINLDPFTEDQIIYPDDITDGDGCFDANDYDPEIIGSPIFLGDACDLVGANFEDQTFFFNNQQEQGCFKILRKWTVIDWCQEDIYGNFVKWTHTQIIKINNNVGPEIACNNTVINVCTFDPDCSTGDVTLVMSATDDCTLNANLEWTYQLDANCDGTYDITESGFGNIADASGNYPIGSHCILWTFSDQCGNTTSCFQDFTITNCKAPTPYCLNGLAVDLMPMDLDNDGEFDFGMVELWASDFDAGSFHPCGNEVFLSFSEDINETNMLFDCTTLGDVQVEIWATTVLPDGTLIQAYCETFVNVQDNNFACPEGNGGGNPGGGVDPTDFIIEGRVLTEMQEEVNEVSVVLEGANMSPYMTNNDGNYAFPPMPLGGSYIIDPTKNIDPLNGVSTLDILEIQRHILEISELDSPYKQIAADVNKDYTISALDLLQIRKLILGINDGFPNNESWVFVDANYTFTNDDALSTVYPEVYDINNLNSDMTVDFVAVKTGDVNNTAVAFLNNDQTENRSADKIELNLRSSEFTKGKSQKFGLYAANDIETFGFQFTIKTDKSIEILDAYSEQLGLNEANVGFAYANDGYVTVSWNTTELQTIPAGTEVLSLVANINSVSNINSQISISSDITRAELYTTNYDIKTPVIVLDGIQGNEIAYTFDLYQNSPNPFTGATEIKFMIPDASQGRLTITDVSGKVIMIQEGNYVQGLNTIMISKGQINTSGILYYTLETEEYTATKKMVVLR